ncbi:MAG: transglutaminase-like domain-containing protein [Promethearchaeota archaeon]
MSDLREELLGAGINKKRVIGVILVALLLVSVFAFSTFFINLLFGTRRLNPNKEKASTDYEDAELTKPPFPFDEDFLMDLFGDLSPEQQQEVMDMLEEMMDSSIDDLDLSLLSAALLALLASQAAQRDVFKVYDYDSFTDMESKLWRYECFDEFTGSQWQSTAATSIYDFTTSLEAAAINSSYSNSLDRIKLKMPFTPQIGANAKVIPSFFPTPFIMENSVYADNLNLTSLVLYKTDFNCTTLDLEFWSADPVNMTYELFGLPLPSNEDINNSAVETQYTPPFIKNKYLQLPPSIDTYINTHPFFKSHYDVLDEIIEDTDNTFVVANKIRNYLQSNFTLGFNDLMNDPPADDEDIVEWFCEHGEGYSSEFTSAFCAFARAFNVSSRFVDGFHSRGIVENYDFDEGKNYFGIKYLNLYNWAEIYVPTSVSGEGMWAQMDIIYDSFGEGGSPASNYNIEVYSNFTAGYRGQWANITAILNATSGSVENKQIVFTDVSSGLQLDTDITDQNGIASILVNVNDSFVVGPHVIVASYQLSTYNYTYFMVFGDIEVNLLSVNPTFINRSISNTTNIQGYVYDPIANQRVVNATVEFVLLQKGTENKITTPFDITFTMTDDNGDFNEVVIVNPWVQKGQYDIRVDFNGSNQWPIPWGSMNDSSNRIGFDITEEATLDLLFYINDIEASIYDSPIVPRYTTLTLKAITINETGDPVQGELVEFYDYSSNFFIGSNITDINGITTFDYYVDTSVAGPNLLYALNGPRINYSYFILDAPISINLDIWPQNREISKGTSDRTFFIYGFLNDTQNLKPIKTGGISIHLFDGSTEIPNALILESGSYLTNQYGRISAEFSVNSFVGIGNYTLEVWFNGTFFHPPPIPNNFFLFSVSNFSVKVNANYQLRVYDPSQVEIIFKIEGNHRSVIYSDLNPPETYSLGDLANFEVWINQGGSPAPSGSIVRLRDIYSNTVLGTYTYNGIEGGYHQFLINTGSPALYAGLHYIEVEYENIGIFPYNSTYIIINETVSISGISNDYVLLRDNDVFTISGTVSDGIEDLRGLEVEIILLDSSLSDVSYNLNLLDPKTKFIDDNGDYSFTSSILQSCPQGEYHIIINFTGRIQHSDGILVISLLNPYMVSSYSSLITLNITAGTIITQDGYHTTPHDISDGLWWEGDTLFVYGNLTWDNGTAITNRKVNVTVQTLIGGLIVFNEVFTDQWGGFNASFLIDEAWSSVNYVYETKIIVYFDPQVNNLEYVEPTALEFT